MDRIASQASVVNLDDTAGSGGEVFGGSSEGLAAVTENLPAHQTHLLSAGVPSTAVISDQPSPTDSRDESGEHVPTDKSQLMQDVIQQLEKQCSLEEQSSLATVAEEKSLDQKGPAPRIGAAFTIGMYTVKNRNWQ